MKREAEADDGWWPPLFPYVVNLQEVELKSQEIKQNKYCNITFSKVY